MNKFPTFQAVLIALIIGMAWGLINVRSKFTALQQERNTLLQERNLLLQHRQQLQPAK